MKLQACHHQKAVGILSQSEEGLWMFEYDDDWKNFELSPHIPKGAPTIDTADKKTVQWFFENLLPEGEMLRRLSSAQGVLELDSWGILSRAGWDLAGAISLIDDNDAPPKDGQYIAVSDHEIIDRIEGNQKGELLAFNHRSPRFSLAGTQEKIALFRHPNTHQLCYSNGALASNVILKPENLNPNFPHCPANEWFCMTLGKSLGLDVPDVHLQSFGDHRVYLVERYDRKHNKDGFVERLHQVDLCQMRNAPRHKKYEGEGGLSVVDLIQATQSCEIPVQSIKKIINAMVFNFLIGNNDAHAKNYSFLMNPKPTVSPIYDVICVEAYLPDSLMSMSIGGYVQPGFVERSHWVKQAQALDINPELFFASMRQLSSKLPSAMAQVFEMGMLS